MKKTIKIRDIKEVKVGHLTYSVARKPAPIMEGMSMSMWGTVNPALTEILILDRVSEQRETEVLLHEAIHGMLYTFDMRDHDERLITLLTGALFSFIRENPALVEAIQALPGCSQTKE